MNITPVVLTFLHKQSTMYYILAAVCPKDSYVGASGPCVRLLPRSMRRRNDMKSGLKRTLALAVGLCTLSLPVSAATTAFSDVPSTYWGYSYITEAASKGLVSGIGNGKYGPEDTLSNSQFITMVCNYVCKKRI